MFSGTAYRTCTVSRILFAEDIIMIRDSSQLTSPGLVTRVTEDIIVITKTFPKTFWHHWQTSYRRQSHHHIVDPENIMTSNTVCCKRQTPLYVSVARSIFTSLVEHASRRPSRPPQHPHVMNNMQNNTSRVTYTSLGEHSYVTLQSICTVPWEWCLPITNTYA
jgi:hypothetical protein